MRRKQNNRQSTFFSYEERQEKLVSTRGALVRLDKMIRWERFRNLLLQVRKDNSVNRKSKTRCRIEPIFGDMTSRMKTLIIRTIGLARVEVKIGLMNLAYDMRRFLILTKNRDNPALNGDTPH